MIRKNVIKPKVKLNDLPESFYNPESIKVADLRTIKDLLNIQKSRLDNISDNFLKYIMKSLDKYYALHKLLKRKYNAQIVTNAWLKCYEIINEFNLVTADNCDVFLNAELPGSFICSINHYIKTKTDFNFNWMASSYIGDHGLADRYYIYEYNKQNWVMNSECNGDITDINNIDYIENKVFERFPSGVGLYTSDIGVDASNNYSEQEQLNSLEHLGQIILGLRILKKGGNMFIKQYTYFTSYSISLIIILSIVFDHLYICKPLTSKPTNSEIYIVCKGYNGINFKLLTVLINALTTNKKNKTLPTNSLINLNLDIFDLTIGNLIDITKLIHYDKQCKILEYTLNAIDSIICDCNVNVILNSNAITNYKRNIHTDQELDYNIQNTMDNLIKLTQYSCSKCNNVKWKKVKTRPSPAKQYLFSFNNNIYEHNKWLFFNNIYFLSDNNHIKTKYSMAK
jgi:cap2 methyltransferase